MAEDRHASMDENPADHSDQDGVRLRKPQATGVNREEAHLSAKSQEIGQISRNGNSSEELARSAGRQGEQRLSEAHRPNEATNRGEVRPDHAQGPGGSRPNATGGQGVPRPRKKARGSLALEHGGTGEVVQLLKLNTDHSFTLNDAELSEFLLKNDVKHLNVVIVSVAGAFRKGKSFLLSFLLRYMKAKGDPNWMGSEDDPLTGFGWKGGYERHTAGVLLWGEIFKVELPSGETVGVILMDTQGSFDSQSTVKECATIFALSTMTSSVQVYNLSQNLQEDDLQHLQLFTEYGKLATVEGGSEGAPFQKLVFLIRDWSYPYDAPFGAEGGQQVLEDRLEINDEQHGELQMLRQNIRNCFSSIECFLMPHPGLKVATSPSYDGRTKDMSDDFVEQLKLFVPSILAPENLVKKAINGKDVTCKELLEYIRVYVKIFGSNELPEPKSILSATAEANNLAAVAVCKDFYDDNMEVVCGGDQSYVEPEELEQHHALYRTETKSMFEGIRKMGGAELSEGYLGKLLADIDRNFVEIKKQNERKNLLATLRTPISLCVALIGLYSCSSFLSLFQLSTAARICSLLVVATLMAIAAWMYVQYTGKHRAVGVEIERGAEVLWSRFLTPIRQMGASAFLERAQQLSPGRMLLDAAAQHAQERRKSV